MSQYSAMPDASAPPVYESVAPPGGVNPQQPAPQQNTAAPVVVVSANANPNAVLKQFAGVQPQQQQPQATYAIMPQQPAVYYQQQPQQPLGAAPQQPAMSRDGQPAAAAAAAAGAGATQYPGAYQYQPPQPYPGQPMPQYVPGQPPQQYPGAAAYPGQPQMMAGGAGGAAVGGQQPQQQTVIYASGAPLPMYFTHQSQLVICPVCRAQAPTMVEYEPGLGTWAICCGLACVGCWVGCCLIPFCVPECQDATHRCPACKNVVGRKALIS